MSRVLIDPETIEQIDKIVGISGRGTEGLPLISRCYEFTMSDQSKRHLYLPWEMLSDFQDDEQNQGKIEGTIRQSVRDLDHGGPCLKVEFQRNGKNAKPMRPCSYCTPQQANSSSIPMS